MISYEMVRDVVQTLIAAGKEPSRKRVRDRLGEGSYQTLGPLIDQAKVELGYAGPLVLVEDDAEDMSAIAEIDAPGAGYTPPAPDPGEVERHLATLRTQTAIAAARSHLTGLCAALRCVAPALERIHQHLHQQYLAGLLADGPLTGATIVRPPYQEPLDTLTTASATMLEAAQALLCLLEPPAASIEEEQDGRSKPAA